MYRDQFGEFVWGYLGLKELIRTLLSWTVFLVSSPYIFSKFNPRHTDTPLMWTPSMAPLVSLLRNGPAKNDSNNGNEHAGMQKRC